MKARITFTTAAATSPSQVPSPTLPARNHSRRASNSPATAPTKGPRIIRQSQEEADAPAEGRANERLRAGAHALGAHQRRDEVRGPGEQAQDADDREAHGAYASEVVRP